MKPSTAAELGVTATGMSRRTVVAWLGGAAAIALPACGASTTPAQQAATSKAPASIIYSTTWDQLRVDVLNRGMAIFREKFSHIKVEVVPGQQRDKVTAAFAAGSGPDSLWIEGQIGPRLYESGSLLDLTSRVKTAKINLEKDYISSKLEKWGPKVFAMPHTVSPHAWYYNKSLLKRAGAKDPWDDLKGNWTWADMLDMTKKVTKVVPGGSRATAGGLRQPVLESEDGHV
jgi:multiple sugar transport system substrate-binding protein